MRRKHLELAEQGKPAGQLGWGVRTDDERGLVREAAQRVLVGHGLMTIARDWNGRGIPGPSPTPWTATTLRRVLISARVVGLREHGGAPHGGALGHLTPAVWQPALDRATWDQLRAVLLNPERNTNVRAPSKYLLTGLIHCGSCGSKMVARPRDDHTRRYLCVGRRPGHQLGIVAQPVDDLVGQRALSALGDPSFRAAVTATGDRDEASLARSLAELGSAQSRLQGLDDDFYVRGALPEARYRSIRVKLEREIDRLHAAVDAMTKRSVALNADPRGLWETGDFQQRRALVRLVVERVEVAPARPGVGRFDTDRVQVEFRPFAQSAAGRRQSGRPSRFAVDPPR